MTDALRMLWELCFILFLGNSDSLRSVAALLFKFVKALLTACFRLDRARRRLQWRDMAKASAKCKCKVHSTVPRSHEHRKRNRGLCADGSQRSFTARRTPIHNSAQASWRACAPQAWRRALINHMRLAKHMYRTPGYDHTPTATTSTSMLQSSWQACAHSSWSA